MNVSVPYFFPGYESGRHGDFLPSRTFPGRFLECTPVHTSRRSATVTTGVPAARYSPGSAFFERTVPLNGENTARTTAVSSRGPTLPRPASTAPAPGRPSPSSPFLTRERSSFAATSARPAPPGPPGAGQRESQRLLASLRRAMPSRWRPGGVVLCGGSAAARGVPRSVDLPASPRRRAPFTAARADAISWGRARRAGRPVWAGARTSPPRRDLWGRDRRQFPKRASAAAELRSRSGPVDRFRVVSAPRTRPRTRSSPLPPPFDDPARIRKLTSTVSPRCSRKTDASALSPRREEDVRDPPATGSGARDRPPVVRVTVNPPLPRSSTHPPATTAIRAADGVAVRQPNSAVCTETPSCEVHPVEPR